MVVVGDHCWRVKRHPLTFQVTCWLILSMCSCLLNLRRNLLGPIAVKERGMAKFQALIKATLTAWLLCVFWEMMWTMRGKLSFKTMAIGVVSIWDERSSHERASGRAMSASMKGKEEGKWRGRGERRRWRGGWGSREGGRLGLRKEPKFPERVFSEKK